MLDFNNPYINRMIIKPYSNNYSSRLNSDVGDAPVGINSRNVTYSKQVSNEIENLDVPSSGDGPISRNTDDSDNTYSYSTYRRVEILAHFVSIFVAL